MPAPVLVIADVHGNLEALKAVLRREAATAGDIWMLGDIAGYGPDPGACLDLLRRLGAVMIAGNHDLAAAGAIGIEDFNDEAGAAIIIHRRILTAGQKDFLSRLPLVLTRGSVTLAHGNPADPVWGYVHSRSVAAAVLSSAATSLTLTGHTHIPALWMWNPVSGAEAKPVVYDAEVSWSGAPHLANPGSVGQSRDGDFSARYMILNPERKTLVFRRCPWRGGPVKRRMRRDGYPESLIRRTAP